MFRKLSLELEHCSKGEDKGGSVTGQFCEIGQNRGELGKTGREQIFLSLLSILDVSQLQLITLNQKLSEFKLAVNQVSPFKDWSCGIKNSYKSASCIESDPGHCWPPIAMQLLIKEKKKKQNSCKHPLLFRRLFFPGSQFQSVLMEVELLP